MYLRGFLSAVDPSSCVAAGGVPDRYCVRSGTPIGATSPVCYEYDTSCQFPPGGARQVVQPAAPNVITFNPTVNTNTQVSPQISPVFVQQDEPQNSPVTATPIDYKAGIEQAAAVRSAYTPVDDYAQMNEQLRRANELEIERQNAIAEERENQRRAAAMIYATSAPSSPAVVYMPESTPAAQQVDNSTMGQIGRYAPAILAVVAVATLLMNNRKRK